MSIEESYEQQQILWKIRREGWKSMRGLDKQKKREQAEERSTREEGRFGMDIDSCANEDLNDNGDVKMI